jgi:hypothetical protein
MHLLDIKGFGKGKEMAARLFTCEKRKTLFLKFENAK